MGILCLRWGVGGSMDLGARQVQHSRQVLRQAHGLPAVIEGVQVGGEEDAVSFEEKLDAHGHVVCRQQMGTVSDGRHRAQR